jgi:hypothetical protein
VERALLATRYWQRPHQQALMREEELKEKVEGLEARIRDLLQRLFGRRSDKSGAKQESQSSVAILRRPRGQQLASAGHGRTGWAHLRVDEELQDLSVAERHYPQCGEALVSFPGTEDSEVLEIEVRAYRRRIRRKRYRPGCRCGVLPGIITAPAPARLIREFSARSRATSASRSLTGRRFPSLTNPDPSRDMRIQLASVLTEIPSLRAAFAPRASPPMTLPAPCNRRYIADESDVP